MNINRVTNYASDEGEFEKPPLLIMGDAPDMAALASRSKEKVIEDLHKEIREYKRMVRCYEDGTYHFDRDDYELGKSGLEISERRLADLLAIDSTCEVVADPTLPSF